MTDLVIETAGLRKIYGTKVAVADLTLQVPRGEVFGFLGPNGAGKSTSIKMLLGLVAPSGGMARVLGRSPGQPATMARVGFLPEHFRFHEWLQAAAPLEAYVGFAIGRSIWWDPLKGFLSGDLERGAAASQIADNYLRFVKVYEQAEGRQPSVA